MKFLNKLLLMPLLLFLVFFFGRSPCLATCDFFQNNNPAPTCTTMTNGGKMWCDTTAPGSATDPVLKVCDGTSQTWNQVELTSRTLNTTFDGTVTHNGAVTNSSTVTTSGTETISGGLTISGTFNDANLTLDGDNASPEATTLCYKVNRGSTSANDPGVCWKGGNTAWQVTTDGSTLGNLEIAAGSSANHAVRHDQVCLLTGDQTIAGIKTFSSFPVTPSSDPTTNFQVANKAYVDTQLGVSFNPKNLDSLSLLLAADAITGLSDNDSVTTWNDTSGAAENVSQSTAGLKPLYKTNILNGKPVVRFDGSDDYLQAGSALSAFATASAKTIFVVFKATSVGGPDHNIFEGGDWRIQVATGPVVRQYNNDGAFDTLDTSISTGTFYIFTGWHDGTNIYNQLNANSATSTASGATSSLTTTVQIGKFGVRYFDGDVAEVLVFNGVLNAAARGRVRDYLNKKYSVY